MNDTNLFPKKLPENFPKKGLENFPENIENAGKKTRDDTDKVIDMGLNQFKNRYPEIFRNINLSDREYHIDLAIALVENLSLIEIIKIITDANIDSNIRLEIINVLSKKQIITKDLLEHSGCNTLTYTKNPDETISLYSRAYFQTLMLFNNGKIVKGILSSVEKDNDGKYIYTFSGNLVYNTNGERVNNKKTA